MSSIVLAQVPVTTNAEERSIDIVKWGITQGGLAIVTLVILWSYRKDAQEWLRVERERVKEVEEVNEELVKLVIANTSAMTTLTETNRRISDELKYFRANGKS